MIVTAGTILYVLVLTTDKSRMIMLASVVGVPERPGSPSCRYT